MKKKGKVALRGLAPDEARSWKVLRSLGEDDLLAMLGSDPSFVEPRVRGEKLLIGATFRKSQQAIREGRRRYRQIVATAKGDICKRWAVFKEQEYSLKEIQILALVVECLLSIYAQSWLPVLPAAELVCRTCSYNLDRLCEGH